MLVKRYSAAVLVLLLAALALLGCGGDEGAYGASPLWERLEAVKRDRVYPVNIYLWNNGGPTGVRDVMLPELFGAFDG